MKTVTNENLHPYTAKPKIFVRSNLTVTNGKNWSSAREVLLKVKLPFHYIGWERENRSTFNGGFNLLPVCHHRRGRFGRVEWKGSRRES